MMSHTKGAEHYDKKSKRRQEMVANSASPALAAALLAVLAIALAACGQGTQEPLVDTGPKAGPSNEQLVRQAVSNMGALKSHHLEFEAVTTSSISGTAHSRNSKVFAAVRRQM